MPGLTETFPKSPDKPLHQKSVDIRRKAMTMIEKHGQKLKILQETSSSSENFRKAALDRTEVFKKKLKAFLEKHGAQDMYETMEASVSQQVSNIVKEVDTI